MTAGTANGNRDHWQTQAERVARRVNLAWWLETLSAPLLLGAVFTAIALVVARREMPTVSPWLLLVWVAGGLLVLAAACFLIAMRKFEKPEQAMVRMEAAMRLRNALSAARAGVAPWPKPVAKIDAGLSWQWPRLLVPVFGALILLAAGLFIPVSTQAQSRSTTPEEPQAWTQLATELDRFTQQEVVDEKYLEETRKRLDELKSQKEEQWFSHSSLEATDSLKKSHKAETQRVARELDRADKALESLEKNAAGMAKAEQNRLMDEFDQALQGLRNGAMKPNPALLEQMQQLDLKDLAKLSPEQMSQLRENMKKLGQAMQSGLGDEGEGEGSGEVAGSGGVDRGPGHAAGILGKEKDQLETGGLTGLQSKDLSQTAPGDLLDLQDGEHDVDQNASRITSGGSTDATGKGGDRVWRDALDPAEQQAIKRFFE